MTVFDIAALFGATYLKTACAEKAVNGFLATGIFPFNSAVFDDTDFAPSAVIGQPDPSTDGNGIQAELAQSQNTTGKFPAPDANKSIQQKQFSLLLLNHLHSKIFMVNQFHA